MPSRLAQGFWLPESIGIIRYVSGTLIRSKKRATATKTTNYYYPSTGQLLIENLYFSWVLNQHLRYAFQKEIGLRQKLVDKPEEIGRSMHMGLGIWQIDNAIAIPWKTRREIGVVTRDSGVWRKRIEKNRIKMSNKKKK